VRVRTPRLAATLAALAVLVASATPVWLPAIGDFLVVADPVDRADAIIVLAGNAPDRLRHGEELFAAGDAPLIIVSDEAVRTHGLDTTWLTLFQAGLAAPELPASAVTVLDPPPDSTIDEATRAAALLQSRGLHSAILVTDPFHTRRASLLFAAQFRHRGLVVHTSPVPHDAVDLPRWWTSSTSARVVLEEYTKLLAYLAQGKYW